MQNSGYGCVLSNALGLRRGTFGSERGLDFGVPFDRAPGLVRGCGLPLGLEPGTWSILSFSKPPDLHQQGVR